MKQNSNRRSVLPFLLGVVAVETAAIVAYARLIRPWFLRWGASAQEIERVLPGDEQVPAPRTGYTRAITINAPIDQVWQWVVQIGQNRGGLYMEEWLENVFGGGAPNAERILPQFQHVAVGEYVLLYPNGPGYAVAQVEPPRSLVLRTIHLDTGEFTTSAARDGAHGTLAFLLEPHMENKTRLIVRMRLDYEPTPLYKTLWGIEEPVTFVMERQLLRGLKERAETHRVPDVLLDQWMPEYEFRDVESIEIHATPEKILKALSDVTEAEMPLAQLLGHLRYLPEQLVRQLPAEATREERFLDTVSNMGFVTLSREKNELVLGAIGKWHDPIDQAIVRIKDADEFRRFLHAEYQKLALSFRVTGDDTTRACTLTLEHRTHPMSEHSRKQFARYWLAIKPGGRFVSRQLLHAIKRRAEAHVKHRIAATPTRPQTPTLKPEFMGA
jgi:hypothetical protein